MSASLQFASDTNAYGVKRIARSVSNASSLDTVGTEYTDGEGSIATEDSRCALSPEVQRLSVQRPLSPPCGAKPAL